METFVWILLISSALLCCLLGAMMFSPQPKGTSVDPALRSHHLRGDAQPLGRMGARSAAITPVLNDVPVDVAGGRIDASRRRAPIASDVAPDALVVIEQAID